MTSPRDVPMGDEWRTYRLADGELIGGEFAWVTDIDFFDEREGVIELVVETWRLVSREPLMLADPYANDEDDDEDAQPAT